VSEPPPRLPMEHIRRPVLPWQTDRHLTECGRDTDGRVVITREECAAKIKRQGKQRAAMTTCMTCAETSDRWATWDVDPVQAVRRQVGGWGDTDPALRDEFIVIAALIEAHREEYDDMLAGLRGTLRLDEARLARRKREIRAQDPSRRR